MNEQPEENIPDLEHCLNCKEVKMKEKLLTIYFRSYAGWEDSFKRTWETIPFRKYCPACGNIYAVLKDQLVMLEVPK